METGKLKEHFAKILILGMLLCTLLFIGVPYIFFDPSTNDIHVVATSGDEDELGIPENGAPCFGEGQTQWFHYDTHSVLCTCELMTGGGLDYPRILGWACISESEWDSPDSGETGLH